MLIIDAVRSVKFENSADQQIKNNENAYIDQAALFTYGHEIARRPITEFDSKFAQLGKKATITDVEKIIRNK